MRGDSNKHIATPQFVMLLAVALLLPAQSAFAQQRGSPLEEGLQQAQEVVTKLFSRLRDGQSFETAADGLLIRGPNGREEVMAGMAVGEGASFALLNAGVEPELIGLVALDSEYGRIVDESRLRRLSFATLDFGNLLLTSDPPDCKEGGEAEGSHFCTAFHEMQRFLGEVKSDDELDVLAGILEALNRELRWRLPAEPVQSKLYKKAVVAMETGHAATSRRVDLSDTRLPWRDVFVIVHGVLSFTVVIDDGRPKIWKIAFPWAK